MALLLGELMAAPENRPSSATNNVPPPPLASVVSDADETFTVPSEASSVAPSFGMPTVAGEVGTLGPYRILKELGRGGMGAVYAAFDTRLDRRLALKVMLPQYAVNTSAKERFLREARAAARISHDNVVTVYEADEREGVPYIAMQYLEGYPLDHYLKSHGSPSLPQILRIGLETAAGLAAAHQIGLVHRDIKPGNLWLEAPQGRVKVLDFGLAKPVDSEVELTKSGAIVGTPAYMSPEQARGLKLDGRSDLFSLGGVLYKLCTGQLPFQGPNTMAVLLALATEEPTPVRQWNPHVPESLAQLIHQLLAKNASARPASADEVVQRLRAIMGEPISATASVVAPQVVYVPIPVTALVTAENPFADIDVDPSSAEAPRPPQPALPNKKPKNRTWLAAVVGVLGLLAVLTAGVALVLNNRGDTPPKGDEPDNPSQAKDKPTPPVVKVNPPKTVLPVDPDRAAAEFVIRHGGGIWVDDRHDVVNRSFARQVPAENFRLTGVTLGNRPTLKPDDFRVFAECQHIKEILFDNIALGDEGLAHFQHSPNLRYLHLFDCRLTDRSLPFLTMRKDWVRLELREQKLTLTGFAGQTELEYLYLWGNNVTDANMAGFAGCKKLKNVIIRGIDLTDQSALHLKDSPTIESLELSGFDTLAGATLRHFLGLKQLAKLTLGVRNPQITAKSLEGVEISPLLESIALPNLAGEGADAILGVDRRMRLRSLSLESSGVTGQGLSSLQGAGRLSTLTLRSTAIGPESLPLLKSCVSLTQLDLRQTKLTEANIKELAQALPHCKIAHDSGTAEPYYTPDDLKALEHVHQLGGKFGQADAGGFANVTELPKIAVPLVIDLIGNKKFQDADLAVFRSTKNIRRLTLRLTNLSDQGLAHLQGQQSLQVLLLEGSPKITNTGIAHLRECRQLCVLSMGSCSITDEALANVGHWPDLASLTMDNTPITDQGVIHLKHAPLLITLNLIKTKITDHGLDVLQGHPSLTQLYLNNTAITDLGLAKLATCTKLKILEVRGTKVTAKGIRELATQLPNCSIAYDGGEIKPGGPLDSDRVAAEWVLSVGGKVRIEGFENEFRNVRQLPKGKIVLTDVDLFGSNMLPDDGLSHLSDLASLKYLNLNGTNVSDANLAQVKNLPKLQLLWLLGTRITNDGLAHVQGFRDLLQLHVSGKELTNEGLAHLKNLPNLKYLVLANTGISDDGLKHLKALTNLDYLALDSAHVTGAGIAYLKDLRNLKQLVLAATPINDEGFGHLKELKNLKLLNLERTKANDAKVVQLKEMKELTFLLLTATDVTDEGLAMLKGLPNLTQLHLTGTKVTAKGIADFQKALPNCKIEHDGVFPPKK